jgi:hypothetical protein
LPRGCLGRLKGCAQEEKDLDRLMVPLRCWDKSYLGDSGMTPLIIEVTLEGPQEYSRRPDSGPAKLSICPEKLLDRNEKRFVGKEKLVFIEMSGSLKVSYEER